MKKEASLRLLARDIRAVTRAPAFKKYLTDLLVSLCRVDTTPNPDVRKMRRAEGRCLDILERELAALGFVGQAVERRPINTAIEKHRHYSLLHFTKTRKRPKGLSARETYAGRSNLVCLIPGRNGKSRGKSLALNAHLDVVAPYFRPRVEGDVVHSRGACDDKGPTVAIVGALKVISKILSAQASRLNRDVVAMFVVEEETGGNGSLSLAIDRDLKRHYESVLVSECTGLKIYPANRGAVWYRAELAPPRGVSAFEMFAFVNEAMEAEGAAIRAESRHPLFPQRPVQTCHGIIGAFGEHPSRICGAASFRVGFRRRPNRQTEDLVRDCIEAGLAGYMGLYGDKTKVIDPATGKPMVGRHYDFRRAGNAFELRVWGATGHMGAIRERDGAITKMAHMVRSLARSKDRIERLGGPCVLGLAGASGQRSLVLEGGQGFVPTHGIEEVMDRMRIAAQRGAENYLRLVRRDGASNTIRVTYEKLHNVAFDGDPDSFSMRNALATAQECGFPAQKPVLGWTVSCDARLFASEYPGMDVLTFGPGRLSFAHSDQEQISVEEIRAAAEFLALFLLRQTGTAA